MIDPIIEFVMSHGKHADSLTIILKGHLIVEYLLDKIISDKFNKPDRILKYSFHKKLEILYSLGFIPKYLFLNIENLNNIRNKYSHDFRYALHIKEFKVYDINKKLLESKKLKKYSMRSNTKSFCVLIILQLRNHLLEKLKINPGIE